MPDGYPAESWCSSVAEMELCSGIVTAFVVGLLTIWLIYRKRTMSLFQRYGIPGPKPSFWSGNLREYIEKRESSATEWSEKYGKFVGFYLGAKPLLIAYDVDFLRIMQVKEFHRFSNKDLLFPDAGFPHESFQRFIEILEDEEWKSVRSSLSRALSTGKIKRSFPIVAHCVDTFMKNIKEQGDRPFDILHFFKKLTFDTTSKSFFGIATDAQSDNTKRFIASLQRSFDADSSNFLITLALCFPEFEFLVSKLRKVVDAGRYFLNMTSSLFTVKMCKDIIQSRKNVKVPPNDLLQRMIEANSEYEELTNRQETSSDHGKPSSSGELYKLSDEDILGNVIGFMAVGYHTTSGALGYCAYMLSKHGDVQEKARQEIEKNFNPEEEIDYARLVNLQYLEQVISETLRLFPPTMPIYSRVCKEDFEYKGTTIPKGAIAVVPVWSLQRDPKYWTEPEKFVPERFSPENRGKIDQFLYQPFGAGPRACIGMRLALSIMKFTLANLLRKYRIENCDDGKELELEYTLFLIQAKNGIRVRVIPLDN